MLKNTTGHYGLITKLFHSGIGATIIYLLYLGYTMTGMEKGADKWEAYGNHKALGILVLISALSFYLWRVFNTKPDDAETQFRGQNFLSKIVKYSLLLIMAIYPISGYVMSSAGGHAIKVFDWFTVPLLIEKNEQIAGIAHTVHGYLLYITLGLLALHVLGALYHAIFMKDDLLSRMTTKFKD